MRTTKQALWRQGRSLFLKPLDTNQCFIDVLYTPVISRSFFRQTLKELRYRSADFGALQRRAPSVRFRMLVPKDRGYSLGITTSSQYRLNLSRLELR
jgi:hypothetical protein